MPLRGHWGLLLDDQHHLRSGWRFGLYAAVLVVGLFVSSGVISLFVDTTVPLDILATLGLSALLLGTAAVAALVFVQRFVDRMPALAFGVGFHERWGPDLAVGLAVGITMVVSLVALTALTGDFAIVRASRAEEFPTDLVLLVGILTVSAANEELVFRGYPFQVLMYGVGTWPATLVMSGLFGLSHQLNPNATWVGTTNTALAGILLCLAYARTRSLWLPFGIHIGWNLGIGPVFGFPLSGMTVGSLWVTSTGGPAWLTGGPYGPEGGVLFTGIMVTAVIVIGTTRRIGVSPSVNRALQSHPGRVAQVKATIFPMGTGGT